jgi:excinuclease ABC subunit A
LSGGEAQRIKLSGELTKRGTGNTIYILDEPSTGLHFEDIRMLIDVLQRLVDDGNTVLVIEHNLDIVKVADHIIDVGPEGGREGGKIVCKGTPEELIKKYTAISHTAKYLKMEIDHMNKIRKS